MYDAGLRRSSNGGCPCAPPVRFLYALHRFWGPQAHAFPRTERRPFFAKPDGTPKSPARARRGEDYCLQCPRSSVRTRGRRLPGHRRSTVSGVKGARNIPASEGFSLHDVVKRGRRYVLPVPLRAVRAPAAVVRRLQPSRDFTWLDIMDIMLTVDFRKAALHLDGHRVTAPGMRARKRNETRVPRDHRECDQTSAPITLLAGQSRLQGRPVIGQGLALPSARMPDCVA